MINDIYDENGLLGNSNSNQFYPVTKDYTEPTWNLQSFYGDGTNNLFTGDNTASDTINNVMVGANKQFTVSMWVRRNVAGATQFLMCRDKSSATTARQFVIDFTSVNAFQARFFTNSTNDISFISTATNFTETREWNYWTVVYDGTQSATNRITVYRNGATVAGTTTQTGTFTTINNLSSPAVNILGRNDVASYSNTSISQIEIYNTNLTAAQVLIGYNNRVPVDIRLTTLATNCVMLLTGSTGTSFSVNWTWTDLMLGATFTSAGMVAGDLINDAPALKQITLIMLHGQSNASGRVPMSQLPSKFRGSLNWIKVWNGTTFVNIDSTLNNNQYSDTQSSNEYGIEYQLAEYLNRRYPKTIYFLKQVQGGSYLANTAPSWNVGVGAEWTQITTDITNAKEWELANGYTITKIRFIWIQGEADSLTTANATNYQTNWTNFLTASGSSIFTNKLKPVFYVQPKLYDCLLSSNQTLSTLIEKATVNAAKTAVQATDTTNYRLINTDGCLVEITDLVHYNMRGIETLADRVGEKIHQDGI